MLPAAPPRSTPLEVQATSYLALSARMVSFSIRSMPGPSFLWGIFEGFGVFTKAKKEAKKGEKGQKRRKKESPMLCARKNQRFDGAF